MSSWTHEYETTHCPSNPWNRVDEQFEGVSCEKFELRRGDFDPTTLEKEPRRERAEVFQTGRLQREEDEFWYAWSFHAPEDFKDCVAVRGTSGDVTLAQFHQHFDQEPWDPPWMFGKEAGGDFRVRRFPTYMWREHKQIPEDWSLIPDSEFRGVWHEIVVHARWSARENGFFSVWADGVKKVSYIGPTCFARGSDVYHKYGLYRTAHPDNPDAVVRYKSVTRGDTQADVTSSKLSP
jgi:hypothetical protein